jgi:hypothetical protein
MYYLQSLGDLVMYWIGLNPDYPRQVDAARIIQGEPPQLEWEPEKLEDLIRTREIIREGTYLNDVPKSIPLHIRLGSKIGQAIKKSSLKSSLKLGRTVALKLQKN